MTRKRKDPAAWKTAAYATYLVLAAVTLLTLLFVPNFPSPTPPGTISMVQYALTGHIWPLALTVFPLAGALVLSFVRKPKNARGLSLALVAVAVIGYFYAVGVVFGDIGIDSQPLIEDITSILQPVFFGIIAPIAVIAGLTSFFSALEQSRSQEHPAWMLKARDLLFPKFSEINYVTLFWCTTLLVILDPSLIMDSIRTDGRVLIFAAAVIYLFVRMLSRKKFGHDAKTWIAFTYYAFLSFLTMISLISQLDSAQLDTSLFHQINITLTGALLVISIIRFLTSCIVFRLNNFRYEKLLTDRFSDSQSSWKDFLLIFAGATLIMWLIREQYTATETILLLTYAYTVFAHDIVFVKLPKVVMDLRPH